MILEKSSAHMPEDSRLCKVTHQDGTASYGYWLGNDPVAPIDCWMLDISEEFCGRKNGEKIQELARLPLFGGR